MNESPEKLPPYIEESMERELSHLSGILSKTELSEAQELVYDGWEAMNDNPSEAERYFRKALKLNPNLADAYNGLAAIAVEENNLKLAEEYYRQAYKKAVKELGTEDPKAFLWWGELPTRPYMRAREGLGVILMETKRYDEAIREFKELLKRNPKDNQGIRYLVAPTYLLKGDIKTAIKEFNWYRRHYPDDIPDPYYLLNWGLALFLNGEYKEPAIKFRMTIFSNPYLIPFILGKHPRRLPIWHSNNLMELEYAQDYSILYGELWEERETKDFLKFLWEDQEIQRDYTELKGLEDINKREHLLKLADKIEGRKPTREFFKRMKEWIDERNS